MKMILLLFVSCGGEVPLGFTSKLTIFFDSRAVKCIFFVCYFVHSNGILLESNSKVQRESNRNNHLAKVPLVERRGDQVLTEPRLNLIVLTYFLIFVLAKPFAIDAQNEFGVLKIEG